jgi:hypothetical protein
MGLENRQNHGEKRGQDVPGAVRFPAAPQECLLYTPSPWVEGRAEDRKTLWPP